ncbi:MAG TPA: hemolysin family protein [Candidatus Acidoferrales bacterium]|jgi:CBS domain containing-hemolysin-like protein|nr:hemolysin family protein [Candidatus Acidoferrales bacterium]
MGLLYYTLGILVLAAGLTVFAYLDRVYRQLGRVVAGPAHANLDAYVAEIEPRLRIARIRAGGTFSLLTRLWLVVVSVLTARAVILFAGETWQIVAEMIFFLGLEVIVGMQFFPALLLARTRGKWLIPLLPVIRLFAWLVWPIQAILEFAVSLLHISDEPDSGASPDGQDAIEAIVDAATEQGILEQDEARLIEQVVEFSDKRVREVMTPRPDVVAIPASASIEQLRRVLVEAKLSRLPVYENNLDEIIGIVIARDVLQVPESESAQRTVRELVRPALFVPEAKMGSSLLKEMQRKSQQMAIVIDEYGSMAGVVTAEDLVEEIVGEIGEEDRQPVPDVIRESSGSMVLRGSLAVEKLEELFGIHLNDRDVESTAATVAGLLNHIAGHVPEAGEKLDYDGLQFEVLEANQRKVLRLRARRQPEARAALP